MFTLSIYFPSVLTTLVILIFLDSTVGYSDRVDGWDYLNLHCRDNENKPVEWWYIYKPPSDVVPYLELGRNFTYISSRNAGRWQPSDKYITSNSMLQYTLSPIYRPTYVDYLAVAIYENQKMTEAYGVLMADEIGGVWIGHTVPGLVNLDEDRPSFPDSERTNGHLLMCLSVDLIAVNEIASVLHTASPKFTFVKTPRKMDGLLPKWNMFKYKKTKENKIKRVKFLTSGESLLVEMLARPPRNLDCLYEEFAAEKQIVLDVYNPTGNEILSTVCSGNNSVRNIDAISLKLKESVQYVDNKTDHAKFAVSTAAPWQELKDLTPQYWTCTSGLSKLDNTGNGGVVICVEDFYIWSTFDNFKINEPKC